MPPRKLNDRPPLNFSPSHTSAHDLGSLPASGGPSSRTLKPVSFSNGANMTSRRLLAHEPPQLTTTSSPLSARAGRARKNGPTAAAAPDAPTTFTKLLRVERVQSLMSV